MKDVSRRSLSDVGSDDAVPGSRVAPGAPGSGTDAGAPGNGVVPGAPGARVASGTVWTDRLGRPHTEGVRVVPSDFTVPAERRRSPLEEVWATAAPQERRRLLADALAGASPRPAADPADPTRVCMTWTVEAPGATSVHLVANGLASAGGLDALAMTRLEGEDVWTATWSVPRDWIATYGFAVGEDGVAPDAVVQGRAALWELMRSARCDPRAPRTIGTSFGGELSVAAAPDAPTPADARPARRRGGRVHELSVPYLSAGASGRDGEARQDDAERVWVYEPPRLPSGAAAEAPPHTPLLVLFDGQVWLRRMGIVPVLDALVDTGVLPSVHVAMVDSRDSGPYRSAHLGVPGGQVDLVVDSLLPLLRDSFAVSPRGADTVVAGQSYGGIAALWTLALSDGDVGHALALSPSLWRFDVADALAAAPHWLTARITSGTFEGGMLDDARALARALPGRDVVVRSVSGGHDWAWWSVRLVDDLVDLLGHRPDGP